jgi:hypothetical protein
MESDANGNSYYVVGGRAYFEANSFAGTTGINSYTYRGFFDQANYVEPAGHYVNKKAIAIGVTFSVVFVAIVVLIVVCCVCKKKKAVKEDHMD